MKKIMIIMMMVILVACQPRLDEPVVDQGPVDNHVEEVVDYLNEDDFDVDEAISVIRELTRDKYKGRQAGLEANKLAEDYLVDVFKSIGLKPIDSLGGYKQTYTQMAIIPKKPTEMAIVGGASFDYQRDFTDRFMVTRSYYEAEVQAGMKTIYNARDLLKDMQAFEGKVILMPQTVFYDDQTWHNIDDMHEAGIAIPAVVTINSGSPNGMRVARGASGYDKTFEDGDPIIIQCNLETFTALMGYAGDGELLKISMDFDVEEVEVANIVGYIPGKHSDDQKETMIIGAHLDHVGDNLNGTFNAGALDNASGVGAIVELARLLVLAEQPEDDIIVVAFNGEEDGLLGSRYFADNPPMDYQAWHTKMLNFDMVGSSGQVPLNICAPKTVSNPMKSKLGDLAHGLGLTYTLESYGGSDHVSFNNKGIQATMLIHYDDTYYHTSLDTLENAINADRLSEVLKLSLLYLESEVYE